MPISTNICLLIHGTSSDRMFISILLLYRDYKQFLSTNRSAFGDCAKRVRNLKFYFLHIAFLLSSTSVCCMLLFVSGDTLMLCSKLFSTMPALRKQFFKLLRNILANANF